jgi:hypothetical protein
MAHHIGALLDIARGIADPAASAAEGHVDTCAACGGTVQTMRRLADFSAREADYEVPPAVAERAEAIFPKREPRGSWVKALAAQLVYDSARDPLPAGARSRNVARQLLYEAGSYSLDLHVSGERGRGEREAPRLIVVGQLSDRRDPAKVLDKRPVELWSRDEVVAQTVSNPLGEFHLESARREALRLRVGVGGRWIEVPITVLEPETDAGLTNRGGSVQ